MIEDWDLWRVQTRDGKPQMAVTLNGLDRTVSFTTTSHSPSGTQTVTFSQQTTRVMQLHSFTHLKERSNTMAVGLMEAVENVINCFSYHGNCRAQHFWNLAHTTRQAINNKLLISLLLLLQCGPSTSQY